MNTELVGVVAEIYEIEEGKVIDAFSELPINVLNDLIDANVQGDTEYIRTVLDPIMKKVTESEKLVIPTSKPRDPMARELAKPQYGHKVTPNKKEKIRKAESKHKQKVDEAVIGFSDLPAMKRLLALAGADVSDSVIQTTLDANSTSCLDQIAQPVGTSIKPGAVDFGESEEQAALQRIKNCIDEIKATLELVPVTEFATINELINDLNDYITIGKK